MNTLPPHSNTAVNCFLSLPVIRNFLLQMTPIFRLLLFGSLALFLTEEKSFASIYTVTNAGEFNNLPRLNAGDVVKISSGNYGTIDKIIESTISDDATAKSNPVLVYATTPGGVVIDSPSKITLSGRGITLAGLDFGPNSGLIDNGTDGSTYIVGTASGSRYMTLSNLRFNGCAAGDNYGHWVYIEGFNCTIQYCSFTEHPDTVRNSTVSFLPNITEGSTAVPRMHKIRYCYFGPRYVVPQDTNSDLDNGFESIRIGTGDTQTFDMQVTAECNVFYHAIWRADGATAGEPEIISNKSKNNKILNNTILESQGGICLRSGDSGTVEGNFIFGAGSYSGSSIVLGTSSANQGGIRVIGQNHIVRNNYIQNVSGTGIRAALSLMSGESGYIDGDPATNLGNFGSYEPAHNAQIYNNTFLSCKEMSLGLLSTDSITNGPTSPIGVKMYNNVWQGNGSASVAILRDTTVAAGYLPIDLAGAGGNYIYETSSSKYGWTALTGTYSTTVSPAITDSFDNYKIPTSTSPLLGNASTTLVASTDVRGLSRPTTGRDIGCYEREVSGSGLKPLLRSDVGPVFDGGPSSYPVAGDGDSKPTILTTALQGGSQGAAFYQALQASGGDGLLTWTVSGGSLPAGLSLFGSGYISGTPSVSGTFTFTARVTDSDATAPDSAELSYTLVIAAEGGAKLAITTASAFSYTSGNRPSYSIDAKTSTRWTSSFSPSTGKSGFGYDSTWIRWDLGALKTISYLNIAWYSGSTRTTSFKLEVSNDGTTFTELRAKQSSSGTTASLEKYDFTDAAGRYVRLVSYGNNSSSPYSTNITEVEIYGTAYSAPDTRTDQSIYFGALGSVLQNDPPFALSASTTSGLPVAYQCSDSSVAVIDGSTVTITGPGSAWITASQPGDISYKAAASVQQVLTVTQVSPEITSSTNATAVNGLPFRYQITATREPTLYGASGLPTGLVLSTATGKISGTAVATGSYTVILTAQNTAGTGSVTLNLNVISPFVSETFESYTLDAAVPTVSPTSVTSGIKTVAQVSTKTGIAAIGGTLGKVAWLNDIIPGTGGGGTLEFNAGSSGQSALAASFEIYNNSTPSASGSQPINVSLAAWNSSNNSTSGGSSSKRIVSLEFNQFGSLTTPAWYVKNAGVVAFAFTGSYPVSNKLVVHLFANDHDLNPINYVGPDGNVRTLAVNSCGVFLNSNFIGSYPFQNNAMANDGLTVLTGNNNLGRLCFNTSTINLGNWLIDNVIVSDLPNDVVIPAVVAPTIISSATVNCQAGFTFNYQTTTSELADSFTYDGVLPTGLVFNTASGLISGSPNQSGIFPVTIYANNSAGTGALDLLLSVTAAPANTFSGSETSLNTLVSWSLGAAPNASSSGGSYTDLVFASSSLNLTTTSGNINGKSYNVSNGSSYILSSLRALADVGGTTYKIGNTGSTDTYPYVNTVTGVANEMLYLANNSNLTFSPTSPINSIASVLQLRNSGILRIETGSTLDVQTSISQSVSNTGFTKTGGGKLILSGANSYTGATSINAGTLTLGGSGVSPLTVKSGAVLELPLGSTTVSSASIVAALSLESGSIVRIVGTPVLGSTYPLVTASSVVSLASLESPISGFTLAVSGNSLVLQSVPIPSITSATTASVHVGSAFSYQITASNSPTSFAAANLPAGLSLNTVTGLISGTPTVVGNSSVLLSVTNAGGAGTANLTLSVTSTPVSIPAVTSAATANGQVGSNFSYQITASNSPTSFGAVNLPAGLSLDSTSGIISGSPTSSGVTTVTISGMNAGGTGTANLTLTVVPATPVVTSLTTASGQVGSLFNYQITASNSPTSYGASNLPAGLSVDTASGIISGTPSASGIASVTLTATNTGGTGVGSLTLTIAPAAISGNASLTNLVLSSGSLSPVFVGGTTSYTATVSGLLEIQVTSTVSSTGATVKVNGTSVASGVASGKIKLQVGSNVIAVVVTAQDGTTMQTYTVTVTQNDNYDALRANWQNALLAANTSSATSVATKATGYQTSMITSGTTYLWSDLPLGSVSANMNSTFSRLQSMALAYAMPTCSLYGNVSLAASVASGLDWMNTNVYKKTGGQYDNWFHWEVTSPQYLLNTVVLLYPALSGTQIANYCAAVDNYGPNSANASPYFNWANLTGANTSSVVLVMAVNGLLVKSTAKLTEAQTNLSKVFPPVTSGDGFYTDGSFVFHGNVAYNGHYGFVQIEDIAAIANLLAGSNWAISESNLAYVYGWVNDGLKPFFYYGAMMDMVRGRSIGSSSSTEYDDGAEVIAAIRQVANFAPEPTKTALTSFANSPHPASGQYHFSNIDRVVAIRSGFGFGLSMSSSRIANFEDLRAVASTSNNLKGWFTGDGMTYLYVGSQDTNFTDDYWATVDYYHLPGTTTEMTTAPGASTTDQSWVGGAEVSGTFGAAGISLHPANARVGGTASTLYGKKSYFMFENEIICLGAGINCSSVNQVDTTVENRRMGSSVTSANLWVDGVQTSRALGSSATLTSPKSCSIDGVGGYYFYNSPSNLQAEFVANSGAWTAVHPTDSDTSIHTNNYLKLYYKHGVQPLAANYAYTLLPGMSPSNVSAYAANPKTVILANTESVQAAKNQTLGLVSANFWGSAGGTADLIASNKASSVITSETYNTISVGISDPTQQNTGSITVTLNRAATGQLSVDTGVTVVQLTPKIILSVNVNNSKGKTYNATFQQAAQAPAITSLGTATANQTVPFTYQITASNSPTSYSATGLPSGLSLDSTTGLISGTPTSMGTFVATITATNSGGSGSTPLTFTVLTGPPSITSILRYVGSNDTVFSYRITATNSPTSYSAAGLPLGLSINASTGVISGTPSGMSLPTNITLGATNSGGTVYATLIISGAVTALTVPGSSTWTCPSNVSSVQVECWGAGGTGGSALRGTSNTATGGGGGGGAYAKYFSYPVTPGMTYYVNVGAGSISSTTDGAVVSGGDSWFNSENSPSSIIIAKGGAGGQSTVTATANKYGTGGIGTAAGSAGNVVNAGGSGATSSNGNYGGGGGGSGGSGNTNGGNIGISATANSGVGALAVIGGGNGGNPNASSASSADGQAPTAPPGGGGGGARAASTTQRIGGIGAAGQVVLTATASSVATVPDAPTGVSATAGNAQASIGFTAPARNGGATITGYTATSSPSGASATGAGSPLVITGLTNGTAYTFTVTATNSVGTGVASSSSLAVTPATVPDAPTGVSVTAGNAQASVGFTIPSNNGGATITGYTATASPGGASATGLGSPLVVTGLTNGTAYTFTVSAANSVGNGSASSASTAVTPMAAVQTIADWRQSNFGTLLNTGIAVDTANPDGDGFSNLQEYVLGASPTVSDSVNLITITPSGASIVLTFVAKLAGTGAGYSGLTRHYALESTTDLTNPSSWAAVINYSNITGANQTVSSILTKSTNKSFYRLKVWLE